MRQTILMFVLILISTLVTAQYTASSKIYGEVTSNGTRLPYINVYIKGTTIGTTTDNEGKFVLNQVPEGQVVLVAQGVGFKSKSSTLDGKIGEPAEITFDLEEDILNLEGVVVTADRNSTTRTEAPVIVNVLTPKLFQETQAISLGDALDFAPGLRVENNCQNCGFTQLRINGLEGPYSQILMNSRPVFSGLAGVYGLELIPANMIQRVEVMRGGGSALFGGNAIAGTVNIITQDPTGNGFMIDARSGIIGTGRGENITPAHDNLVTMNGSIVTEDRKAGMYFYGLSRKRDPFDENGDDFSELVKINNLTLGMSGFYKPSLTTKVMVDFYTIRDERRGGNSFDQMPHESDITEMVDHTITGGSLSFDVFTNRQKMNKLTIYAAGQKINRFSYYGAMQDPNAYGNTSDFTSSVGSQYNWTIGKASSFTAGIENNHNNLEDTKLGADGDENRVITNQYVNTLGSFIQYDLKYEKSKFSFGLRYDNYLIRDKENDSENKLADVRGNVLAPRATYLMNILPTIQYRLSYAKGYRTPQIFDEDLHIESSGSRQVLHANAPDLNQETSHSISSSFNFINNISSVMTEFLVEGFYTRLIDPFAYEYEQLDSGTTYVSIRKNSEDGAYVAGVNLEFNAYFRKNISLSTGFTFQRSRYDSPQFWGDNEESVTSEFLRSPGQYGYLNLDWDATKKFCMVLTSTYTGRMYMPHFGLDPISGEEWELIQNEDLSQIEYERQDEINAIMNGDVIEGERLEKTEPILIFGLRLSYDFNLTKETKLQVYGGVQNIFNQVQSQYDRGVYRDAGYIYGSYRPRTFTIGVKIGNLF
jgi:outer membrane receptor for ferrienterochelin and colicins